MAIKTTKVHIITWDHVEYDREATDWEIAKMKREGFYKETQEGIVFDFRHI